MNGIYAVKSHDGEKPFWIVKDTKTGMAVATGCTLIQAMNDYEIMLENEKMANELGSSLDDFQI